MNEINDGGPAFPTKLTNSSSEDVDGFDGEIVPANSFTEYRGMSLRDFFAINAPSVPEDFGWAAGETDSYQRIVRWNWFYADEMLKARKTQ